MTPRSAFTMVELLLAVALAAIVAGIVSLVLAGGTEAWRTVAERAENAHDGDAVMEQVAMALRSAYYPAAGEPSFVYGFQHEDGGEGADARDSVSWVKIGSALVGEDVPWSGSAHRVRLWTSQDEDGQGPGLYVASWQLVGQPEDFDPEEDVVPVLLSDRVVAFDCRMQDPGAPVQTDEPYEWIDEWTESNRIPERVLVTLAVDTGRKGEKPDEFLRLVDIPLSAVSWNPSRVEGDGGGRSGGRSGSGGGGRRRFGGGRGEGGGNSSGGAPAPGSAGVRTSGGGSSGGWGGGRSGGGFRSRPGTGGGDRSGSGFSRPGSSRSGSGGSGSGRSGSGGGGDGGFRIEGAGVSGGRATFRTGGGSP